MRKRDFKAAFIGGAAVLLLTGGIAWGAIPGADGVIQGCYDGGGNLKVVAALPCPRGYTPLAWNQQGSTGTDGAPGDSAYQTWLELGNTGTEHDFIESLGGPAGSEGQDGASAYEVWLELGNTGTEQDFVDSLQGAPGQDGNLALAGRGCPGAQFVTGFDQSGNLLCGVVGAVVPRHVYWTNFGTGTIGRLDLDGQNVNQSFITGASDPFGVAVDSGHIYWTNFGTGTIGRALLDGHEVNQSFITGASLPAGVAVDSG